MVMRGDALTTARASRPRAPSAVKRGRALLGLDEHRLFIKTSSKLPFTSKEGNILTSYFGKAADGGGYIADSQASDGCFNFRYFSSSLSGTRV